ncbi:MAG: aminotransferase class I/II-fold pyridoxal phosphate-dependent enzyme, partial [Pseudomonadota bacterium]
MNFPDRFSNLPAYAFPRLRTLLDPHPPGGGVVHMTIGEPKQKFPAWVTDVIVENAALFNDYPVNDGTPALRGAISDWIQRRYGVARDPDNQILPLNGTREGLYNAAMALCPETKNGDRPVVLCPNPFYQVYMVAALSVAAEPRFVPATLDTGHLPDFTSVDPAILDRTAIAYLCSPANPQGTVASRAYWETLLGLAEKHDFRVFADECYCEIYRDTPPVGAMEVADAIGANPERLLAFHSLSKRSNLPGLRSGFVATGPENMKRMKQLRSYAGTPLTG